MKFKQALTLMKQGTPMKLPSWGGYWIWDDDAQTIMMHCRPETSDNGKSVLDIRSTQRVEYTLENILSEDWMEATPENTEILGGYNTFEFEHALKYLKRGLKLTNEYIIGKYSYVYMDPNNFNRLMVVDQDGQRYEPIIDVNWYTSKRWEFYKEPEENQNGN